MEQVNLIPFYACAIAFARHIRSDLEKEYSKNAVTYHNAAKQSEYYNALFSDELSLQTEEAYKKALGIVEYSYTEDEQAQISLDILFKKGYRKLYNIFKRLPKDEPLHFDSVIGEIIYVKLAKSDHVSDDNFNGNLFAGYYFSDMWPQELIERKECDELLYFIANCGYNPERRIQKGLNKYDCAFQERAKSYISQLPKDLFKRIQLASKNDEFGYTTVFDIESLSSVSIFSELQFTREDLEAIAIAYTHGKRGGIREDFLTYAKYTSYILAMCKAYKQSKEYYFQHNREDVYVEVESIKNELLQAKSALSESQERRMSEQKACTEQVQRLSDQINLLKQKNDALKSELQKVEGERRELYALREHIFSLESDSETEIANELSKEQIQQLKNISGTIVGGHPSLTKKLKTHLPDWQYISAGDVSTVRNSALKKSDFVFFVTAHLSHKLYYAMIAQAQDWNAKIGYLSRMNIDYALQEIYILVNNSI
jgi:hypothetical protein